MQSVKRIVHGELHVLVDEDAKNDILPCIHQNFDSLINQFAIEAVSHCSLQI